MSQTLTIPDDLLARLEAAARRRGLSSVEQLLETWHADEERREQRSPEAQTPAPLPESLEDRFQHLVSEWRRDVWPLSSVTQIVRHPSYQAIIALGREVVPAILRDLEQQPGHWFVALRALTGADPVAAEDRGQMEKMAAAWVRWGKEHGLIS
jgi:hypothetical protein